MNTQRYLGYEIKRVQSPTSPMRWYLQVYDHTTRLPREESRCPQFRTLPQAREAIEFSARKTAPNGIPAVRCEGM